MVKKTQSVGVTRRRLLILLISALALYVIVPQFGGFRDSWQYLRQPDYPSVALAVGCTLVTFGCAAGTYCLLAFRRITYWRTVLVQFAAMFVNRLLPAGVGAAGVGFTYLRAQRHTAPQAATVVAINNMLGFTGHLLLVFAVLVVSSASAQVVSPKAWFVFPLALIMIGLVGLGLYSFGGRRVRRFIKQFRHDFTSYGKRVHRLAAAQLTSLCLTTANVASLYYCAVALDVHLSVVALVIIFTFGIGLGTATPTPGGLGGFEAGLVAGFTTYGVEASVALAIALLYRLLSYWLTLLMGGIAFVIVEKQRLLKI